jgi:MoxR-like ATPase
LAVNLQMLKREVEDFETDVNNEIQIKHLKTEEQLLTVQEDYYELVKDDNQFEGAWVGIKQFRQLDLEEDKVTNFFDTEKNLVNRLKAKKGLAEFTIDVIYNDRIYTYPLRTKKGERTEIIFKTPHPVVQKYWEERFERLRSYLTQQEKQLQENLPDDLHHLDSNLFVDAQYSEIVKSNVREVREALRKLQLQLEKIQYSYTSR